MEKVIVIVGQTAVGKTSFSIQLAKKINGEIINGDALQVYQGLDILTAKIKKEEMENIPHHLLSIKKIDETYSVEEYQKRVREKIQEILEKGKVPILVGGTGLYIKAALFDYNFQSQEKDCMKEIEEKYAHFSNEMLYQKLEEMDKESCKTIHKNNRRRVLRAIAIYELTGIPKSKHIEKQTHAPIFPCEWIGLSLEKEQLEKRINQRVEQMFNEGVVEEVKRLEASITASKAIGFKEIKAYLKGLLTKEECIHLIQLHTRQYSKRQMTWMKNQFAVKWFTMTPNILEEVCTYLKETKKNG